MQANQRKQGASKFYAKQFTKNPKEKTKEEGKTLIYKHKDLRQFGHPLFGLRKTKDYEHGQFETIDDFEPFFLFCPEGEK